MEHENDHRMSLRCGSYFPKGLAKDFFAMYHIQDLFTSMCAIKCLTFGDVLGVATRRKRKYF